MVLKNNMACLFLFFLSFFISFYCSANDEKFYLIRFSNGKVYYVKTISTNESEFAPGERVCLQQGSGSESKPDKSGVPDSIRLSELCMIDCSSCTSQQDSNNRCGCRKLGDHNSVKRVFFNIPEEGNYNPEGEGVHEATHCNQELTPLVISHDFNHIGAQGIVMETQEIARNDIPETEQVIELRGVSVEYFRGLVSRESLIFSSSSSSSSSSCTVSVSCIGSNILYAGGRFLEQGL